MRLWFIASTVLLRAVSMVAGVACASSGESWLRHWLAVCANHAGCANSAAPPTSPTPLDQPVGHCRLRHAAESLAASTPHSRDWFVATTACYPPG
jgi:hypothetical protein